MRVSVIVPAYQQAHFLAEAVASACAQTMPVDEIIVVAGDAESAREARGLGVRCIVAEPRGLSDARNVGILAARGDLILPLDADDQLEHEFVAQTATAIQGHDIAGTWVTEFDGRWQRWGPTGLDQITERNGLPYASLFRRELWVKIGGYARDIIGWEDWGLWLAAREVGASAVVVPECLLRYRVHAASKSSSERGLEDLWHAMLRLRHPKLYAQTAQDQSIVAGAPPAVRAEVLRRLKFWPEDEWLQRWAAMMGLLKSPGQGLDEVERAE